MFSRVCLLVVLGCSILSLTFLVAQNRPVTSPQAQDLEALKADAQRMHVILNQMRANLAFVDTTQSPLKHQFELETDMWQVQLQQMDRRIAALESEGSAQKK
jgi:hypothetical protein